MNCPACGRKMLVIGSFAECTNMLCDYEEEIEHREVSTETAPEPRRIIFE